LLGEAALRELRGLRVLDFGCGDGAECIELAKLGASTVFGLDMQSHLLEAARERARAEQLTDRCQFGEKFDGDSARSPGA